MISHTKQEWFELGVRGMAAQGWRRSVDGNGSCIYGEPGGIRCIVGHGLGDEQIAENYQSVNAGSLAENGVIYASDTDDSVLECEFFTQLQGCHDDAHTPEGVRTLCIRFAAEHGLEWPSNVSQDDPLT